MPLQPHPRLFIDRAAFERLDQEPTLPLLRQARAAVLELAAGYRDDAAIEVDWNGHNAHLIRARCMQTRVLTLVVAYRLSGDLAFKRRALDDLDVMGGWDYWSWIAWRKGEEGPEAIFDLSYGENSATLALAFDWLADELSEAERDALVLIARRWSIGSYLANAEKSWWFVKPDSNWNTVCNGGAGLLALAMHEHLPEAERVLELVERGVGAFFGGIAADGGWPEGIGYWNYGMRYGFWYLLGRECSTGTVHPLLERETTRATLNFPLRYCPNGVATSFGDVNRFQPLPFHLQAARRCGADDVVRGLLAQLGDEFHAGSERWPFAAMLLLQHPWQEPDRCAEPAPLLHFDRGLEWLAMADRWPQPRLYASVRAGTTQAPHTHQDLTSFQLVVGGHAMIQNVPVTSYLDSTFSPRRHELYELGSASKNLCFVNGVSQVFPARVASRVIDADGVRGLLMDGAEIFGQTRDGPAAKLYRRAVLMIEDRGVLVLDRVLPRGSAMVESRFHSFQALEMLGDGALLRADDAVLRLTAAADAPLVFGEGMGLQTLPDTPDRMVRVFTRELVRSAFIAVWLAPVEEATLGVTARDGAFRIALSAGGWRRELAVDGELTLA